MLEQLALRSKSEVANEWHLTLRGLDSWLHRIRQRRKESMWYMDRILRIERRSSRMQKILLSAELVEEEKSRAEASSEPIVEKPEVPITSERVYCPHLQREVQILYCNTKCKTSDWNKWSACQEYQREHKE